MVLSWKATVPPQGDAGKVHRPVWVVTTGGGEREVAGTTTIHLEGKGRDPTKHPTNTQE